LTNNDNHVIINLETNKRGINMTQVYKPKEFANIIKVSTRTLSRWDEDGKFVARRNPSGGKFYTDEDLNKYLGKDDNFITEAEALMMLLDFSQEDVDNGRVISIDELMKRLSERKSKAKGDTKYLLKTDNNKNRLKESIEQAEKLP
tara:strand:- start:23986 stop:24423 length:438 start_codon:yes stop_codon:yes gene_type:complete